MSEIISVGHAVETYRKLVTGEDPPFRAIGSMAEGLELQGVRPLTEDEYEVIKALAAYFKVYGYPVKVTWWKSDGSIML